MDYSLEPLSVTKIQSMDYFYAQSCKIVKCLWNLTSQTAFLTFFFFWLWLNLIMIRTTTLWNNAATHSLCTAQVVIMVNQIKWRKNLICNNYCNIQGASFFQEGGCCLDRSQLYCAVTDYVANQNQSLYSCITPVVSACASALLMEDWWTKIVAL